jgi:hypothetical protein
LSNRQLNFDWVYSETGTKRSYEDIDDQRSLSESEATDNEIGMLIYFIEIKYKIIFIHNLDKSSCVVKKNNDFQLLSKKTYRKKKKQAIESIINGNIFFLL